MATYLGRVPIEKFGLDPTSRPGVDPTLNLVRTSSIILGGTHFSLNEGSSQQTRMSVYKYVQFAIAFLLHYLVPHPKVQTTYMR